MKILLSENASVDATSLSTETVQFETFRAMHLAPISLALATLALATPATEQHSESPASQLGSDFSDLYNNTLDRVALEKRATDSYGYYSCQKTGFRAPCAWYEVPKEGALACQRLLYTGNSQYPDISFGPDKGVTCKVYNGAFCESVDPIMFVDHPGGNIYQTGKERGMFSNPNLYPGFYSFRCRSWKNKDPDDIAQSKIIPLPNKP